jgi:hypothetical protein
MPGSAVMPYFNKTARSYLAAARVELDRLKAISVEFRRSNEASERNLRVAAMLEEGTKARLHQRAEEARLLAAATDSALAEILLLELADGYDGLACSGGEASGPRSG